MQIKWMGSWNQPKNIIKKKCKAEERFQILSYDYVLYYLPLFIHTSRYFKRYCKKWKKYTKKIPDSHYGDIAFNSMI